MFDAPFILKSLVRINKTLDTKYTFDIITRDNSIIKLIIKRTIDKKVKTVVINDSLAILPSSLKYLANSYKVDVLKGNFPHKFVSVNTLFYTSVTPDINYYTDISPQEYSDIYSSHWSLKEECLKSLNKDLVSLHMILTKVNKSLFLLYDVRMTKNLTISGIAMNIFFDKFYQHDYDLDGNDGIPFIKNTNIFMDIKKAY